VHKALRPVQKTKEMNKAFWNEMNNETKGFYAVFVKEKKYPSN